MVCILMFSRPLGLILWSVMLFEEVSSTGCSYGIRLGKSGSKV